MMKGKITQVMGSVIDVAFADEKLPAVKNALVADWDGRHYTMEVSQHIGDNTVRCILLDAAEGLARGIDVADTGKSIDVPVGEAVLGRLFNVTGGPLDGGDPLTVGNSPGAAEV